jgi:ribosome-associated translation inhibitor RaiA
MTTHVEGIRHDATLRTHVERRLAAILERLRMKVTAAKVLFADENGPKGGVDHRCTITIEVPRRPPVPVHAIAEAPVQAFESALGKLERQIERERGRLREARRRPKKYYVAKQLLSPEAVPDLRQYRRGA